MYQFIQNTANVSSDALLHNISLIISMEQKYGISFPDVLRDYYIHYNCYKISLCVFRINNNEYEVAKIIPLDGDTLTFEKIVDNDRADGFISSNFYPLASNRGGDLYYWDCNTQNLFLVYADDVEHPISICHSITEFFKLMSDSASEL